MANQPVSNFSRQFAHPRAQSGNPHRETLAIRRCGGFVTVEFKAVTIALPWFHRAYTCPILNVPQNLHDLAQPRDRFVVGHPVITLRPVLGAGPQPQDKPPL